LALWWLSVMFGLLFGILMAYIPEVNKILNLLTRPLFFISGVFFALQDFPKEYWHYLDWNPILHAIELTRYAAYPAYGNEGVSVSFLSMVTLIITFLSLSVYHTNWRQAISR
jgi:capsular polysaccharide transport system permease protein